LASKGSYIRIIISIANCTSAKVKQIRDKNSLNDKILNANSIAKFLFMVDENLHGNYLNLSVGEEDHFFILVIPLQL
jgi:hypothetical protein